jgi:predicted DNA-binding antitoxin AbrB/MazE fold protein
MYQAVKATYENGVLKPAQELPLKDQEQVLILVLTLQSQTSLQLNLDRVAVLKEQAATWLAQQPADAVRPPLQLSSAQEQSLDEGFDAALAAIRSRSSQVNLDEMTADVSHALSKARSLSPAEQTRLETELDAFLAEWSTDVR